MLLKLKPDYIFTSSLEASKLLDSLLKERYEGGVHAIKVNDNYYVFTP
ncbi:hypothetical protein DFR27_0635 [Umboniibacter marinipuniceus]|uniref:Uncharacterized protein n=1 Tax=Umboniibacter marinipuniceus TaxID=569599 RepID=A0A3M0AUP3_9GAMM|nr:hypothetical protein DFR27_0635 [Umboniibacter marinipuniceus]